MIGVKSLFRRVMNPLPVSYVPGDSRDSVRMANQPLRTRQ